MRLTARLPRLDGPARPLFVGTFVYALGRGIYSTGSIVFFTLSFGLSAQQIAWALSAAGVAAFCAAMPAGYLADRWGARPMTIAVTVVQALSLAPMLFSGSSLVVVPLTIVLGAADRVNSIARRTLVSHVIGEAARVRTQAYLRSVANTGMSIGALAVTPLLAFGGRGAFLVLIALTMGAYVLVVLTTLRLPTDSKLPPTAAGRALRAPQPSAVTPGPARRRLVAFTALGLLNGLFALHISILEVGLPLWITRHTDAPAWTVATLVFVNTVLAVLLQVPASRGSASVRGAARALAFSALFTALACVLFATTAKGTGTFVIVTLSLATVVLTVGELLQSAGEWGLSFGLAPTHAQGRYIGAFTVGTTVQDIVGPAVVGGVALAYVPGGWVVLAAVFLGGAVLIVPMTRLVARLHRDGDGPQPGREQTAPPASATNARS
ncbi:MFS transporter [Streptomyces sp. NPDC048551]|uniref:MFS transporter n=1 Tax=Streptomyces sp. NPDC048551 TaxID=3155758 RepID=UPI003414FA7E